MTIDFCTIDKIARKDDEFVIITSLLTLPYCIFNAISEWIRFPYQS